jgi:hypothetical protein
VGARQRLGLRLGQRLMKRMLADLRLGVTDDVEPQVPRCVGSVDVNLPATRVREVEPGAYRRCCVGRSLRRTAGRGRHHNEPNAFRAPLHAVSTPHLVAWFDALPHFKCGGILIRRGVVARFREGGTQVCFARAIAYGQT